MALTVLQVKNAKPDIKPDGDVTNKPYRITDEKGLYLEVSPLGARRKGFR